MNPAWPMIPLGELLREERRRINSLDADGLPLLGVSNEKGLHRSSKLRIGDMSRYFRVERGWFAYNPMRINVGSIGWADAEALTGVISPDYVVFSCSERIEPRLLYLFLKSRIGLQAINFETAGSVRDRLYFDSLATIQFPLPPIQEQRRIVGRMEALAVKIGEAKQVQEDAMREIDSLYRAIIQDESRGAATPTPMRELVRLREPDVEVVPTGVYQFAGVYCFGRGVFVGPRKTGTEFAYRRLTRLCAGNFVYPKLMAWEGALAVVPHACNGLVVSTEFPVFEIDEDKVLPEVLDVYFRTPAVWPLLSGASTGTNIRRRRLKPSDFLKYPFPLPSMPIQRMLRGVKSRAGAFRPLQVETDAELDALLPSVLAHAFAGKL